MDLPWYAVLFWIWVFVSVGVLVWRRLNPGRDEATGDAPPSSTSTAEREWPPPPPEDEPTGAPASRSTDPPATPPVVPDRPASSPGAPSSFGRAPSSFGRAPAPLSELLAGITLPHELVPLTQFTGSQDMTHHIVVATDAASPEDVRTALADELEKLGYTLSPTGERTAEAEGPRGRLTIEIHPDPARVLDDNAPRFPTATPGMVVVELRTG